MKMNILLLFLFTTVLIESCEFKKSYKYVEIVYEESILRGTGIHEKEPEIIKAISDSAAYLDAYLLFCISKKVTKEMEASLGIINPTLISSLPTPIRFKLLDDNDNDISNLISFKNKEKLEKEIEEKVNSIKSN